MSTTDSEARDRGLQGLTLLNSGESFAAFINASLIQSKALAQWDKFPKRINHDGQGDPNGPVHLTGFFISFESPNSVVTRIDGFDEDPWPDVDFHLTITDTLSASAGALQCQSKRDLDTDTGWLNFLTEIFSAASFFTLWALAPAIFFLTERFIVGSVCAPSLDAGAGCGAIQLFPVEILIQGGLKTVFTYKRLNVTTGGIFAGGDALLLERTPVVTISGPTQIAANKNNNPVERSYSLSTEDLRGQLRVSWTTDANSVVLNPTGNSTYIQFRIDRAQPKQAFSRPVAVSVTNQDNLSAQANITVGIYIVSDTPDDPPICRTKPWLPQCQ